MLDGSLATNKLTETVIGAAMKVHTRLGPGLLEHAYVRCLKYELERVGLMVLAEAWVDLKYDGLVVKGAYRLDLIIDDTLVIEVKAVEKVLPVHHSQVLTYLKLTGNPVGLLLNFNCVRLADGIKRFVNGLPTPSAPTADHRVLREE